MERAEGSSVVMAGEEEDHGAALLEWRIDNFGCWNGDFHDKVIKSPDLEVPSDSGFFCTLELYPKGLTGSDEHLILRVSYRSNRGTTGLLTFAGSDGNLLCVQHEEDMPQGYGVVIYPPGPKLDMVVKNIRKHVPWHKDRFTLLFRIRNLPPSVQRLSTKIKAIDTTFKIHKSTFLSPKLLSEAELNLRHITVYIADVPPFLSDEGTMAMFLEAASRDGKESSIMTLKFRKVPTSNLSMMYLNNFLVYTRLCVLDGDDVVTKSEDDEHQFVNELEWTFSKSLTLRELRQEGVSLLLRVKIIPTKRYEHATVYEFDSRKVDVVPTFRTERHFTNVYQDSERNENSVKILSRQLSCLYQDREFSDFQLRCENVVFPVHRNILSTRSPVFKSMLSSNMRETESGCMDMEDMDHLTLDRFLKFLYTGVVGDLEGESALKLYYAADKYQVSSLQRDCADYLSANITNSNVCDVLSFGDRHRDYQMYTAALDFILKKYNAVLVSREWDVFMEREPELAARVVSIMAERRA